MSATLKAQKKTKIVSSVRKNRKLTKEGRVEPILEVESNFNLNDIKVDPEPGDYILKIPKGYKRKRIGVMYSKWLRALRSGRYKKGKDHLAVRAKRKVKGACKTETRYCCLGVLSKLQGRLHFIKAEQTSPGTLYFSDCASPATSNSSHSILHTNNTLGRKIGLGGEFRKLTADPDGVSIAYCKRKLLYLHKPENKKSEEFKSRYFDNFTSLTEANDGGMTFKQIAWVIGRLFRV